MEFLVIMGIVLGIVLILSLLAVTIRVILVKIAKRNGHTSDDMPIHYHMFGFGVYFSILILAHVLYLTTLSH